MIKIRSFQVILTSNKSKWLEDDTVMSTSDIDAYVQLIKDQYAVLGLAVSDVRISWQDMGNQAKKEEKKEEKNEDTNVEVDVNSLPQWRKPVFKNRMIATVLKQTP